MNQFKRTNNIIGWLVFLVAAVTYGLTVEPSASFWDCPEFITTAYKMEVGHPPGAPFFMLTGNFFSLFASSPSEVAWCINMMSALLSAFCILFLFWTITHLSRMLICDNGIVRHTSETVKIMGAGIVGALAYTWSDTFWFSAVEGEVYAYSSMFTALVFWLILKWEDHADEPHSDRWLVLIAYLTGLSIGVHLLNLLCLPAIALVYYYKRQPEARLKGSIVALGVSFLLVAAVLYGIVPGIVKVGGWFELLFVNTLGLGFNSGLVFYLLLLTAVVLLAIWSTTKHNRSWINLLYILSVALLGIPFMKSGATGLLLALAFIVVLYGALKWRTKDGQYLLRKRLLNTSLLCMLMIMIGYSSYAVIVVRSVANPPMDQDSPEDVFSLGSYLNREQYGSKPLLVGPAFTSYQFAAGTRSLEMNKKDVWHPVEKTHAGEKDSYEDVEVNHSFVYPGGLTMLFPRIFDHNKTDGYLSWLDNDIQLHQVSFTTPSGMIATGQMPSQWDNLTYFMRYQLNFMYWRYFMWNFVGRQNGYQGHGNFDKGNWISGIPVIDNALYGDQSLLPAELKDNKAHNVFYFLPLLLGLLGLFYQTTHSDKGTRQFWVVFFLFFMTGLAIILYLNQTPQEPRERDYAYAGSFYAFAIWIGMGVLSLASMAEKAFKLQAERQRTWLNAAVSVAALLVPLQMVSQTWDDHDRSGRYICRDFGLDYINTMPEKLQDGTPASPIIFTNGDNDTFPLWYNQETEGQRTDARVCNLQYLQTEWYTDQMRRPAYLSPALPIEWQRSEYVDNGKHSYFPIYPERKGELDAIKAAHPDIDPYDLKYVIDHFVRTKGYFPTDSVTLKVNADNVRNQGMLLPEDGHIPEKITLSLKWAYERSRGMYRADVMIYEMLARNEWKRPMYMSTTLGYENYAGLQDYLTLEGLAYRITPFKRGFGFADADKMYHNMMQRFKYGNAKDKNIYLDETNERLCQTVRHMLASLAEELVKQGDSVRAIKVLQKSEVELPAYNIFYYPEDYTTALLWQRAGQPKKARQIALQIGLNDLQYIEWYNSLGVEHLSVRVNSMLRYYMSAIQCLQIVEGSPEGKVLNAKFEQIDRLPVGQILQQVLMQQIQQQQGAQN